MNKLKYHITSIILSLILYLTPTTAQAHMLYELTTGITRDVISIVGEETRHGLADIVANSLLKHSNTQDNRKGLAGKVFVIDAGHGGDNPGAVYHNSREADNNLAIAKKLETVLKNKGAKVILTRSGDTTVADKPSSLRDELLARTEISEKSHADLFISIHNNANTDNSLHGAMTFYYKDKEKPIAESIHKALVTEVKMKDKGVSRGNYLVLRENERPSILLEVGFISNQSESIKLSDELYQNKLAYAIGKGVENYYNK